MNISNLPNQGINFLKEVRTELKRVNWPVKSDVIKHTLTVIVFSSLLAVFLGGLDYLFSYLINNFVL